MGAVATAFSTQRRYEAAQRLARLGRGPLPRLPWCRCAGGRRARPARACRARASGSGGVDGGARRGPRPRSARRSGRRRRVPEVPRALPAGRARPTPAATSSSASASGSADYRATRPPGGRGRARGGARRALRRARRAPGGRGAGRAAGASRASSWSRTIRRSAPRDLDALDGVLSGCALADRRDRARSSSTAAPASGRRALTLVPDLHLCVVLERAGRGRRAGRHRAPSRRPPPRAARSRSCRARRRPPTSSSKRVEGVHGPRTLEVFVTS